MIYGVLALVLSAFGAQMFVDMTGMNYERIEKWLRKWTR